MLFRVGLVFIHVLGADGNPADVNVDDVVSLSPANRKSAEGRLFHESVRCVLTLVNGKFLALSTPCPEILEMIKKAKAEEK